MMFFSKHKFLLVAIFAALLVGGIALSGIIATDPVDAPTQSLRMFVDEANQASGITSGAVFTFKLESVNGHFANFGIVRYLDEVRAESVVEERAVTFREEGGEGHAEVDAATNKVVSMHRSIPSFLGDEYPAQEIETRVRDFLQRVYPEFASIESTLTFDPGMKGVRLNNGNYFFRWNDERFALPTGLSMDVAPFVQVGMSAGGFIFSYTNTLPLYREPMLHDLQTLCSYVEMPPSDDSTINTEKGIVTIWYMDEQGDNRYLLLPYEPRTNFEGCSESAKEKLEHIRETDDRNRESGFYD